MRKHALLWLLLFASFASAQEPVSIEIDGTVSRDDIIVLRATEAGRWKVLGPGVLQLQELAPGIGEPRLNEKRTHVSADKLVCIFAGSPGSYSVLFAPDDPEQSFLHLPIFVPGTPEPGPPEPNPDPTPAGCAEVPDDEYDNIGRRACEWVAELPPEMRAMAPMMARVYLSAASRLENNEVLDIGDNNQRIAEDIGLVLTTTAQISAWGVVRARVSADIDGRELNRFDLIDYYKSLAAGLKAE